MDRKIKLLIVGSSQGVYGGIEAFMMAIAEAAMSWPEFEVKLCYKLVKGYDANDNLISMAKKACPSLSIVSRGSKELLNLISWADVVHAQNTPVDIVFPAYLMRKKLFLTVHNRKIPESGGLKNGIWAFTMKLAHKRWFNSNFVWNTWEPKKKLTNSSCIPTVCKLPSQEFAPESRTGFLFMGRWIKNKGIEEILYAYAKSDFDKEKWPLTILGSGPIKEKIMALVVNLNLDSVIFPGFVDDLEKEKLIGTAKWLLAPANTQEDLGLTPIEARSVGVPSIVTRDGGLPESAGPSALLCNPGDIDDLASRMLQAVTMSEKEYAQRSIEGKAALTEFLKPIQFYREQFAAN